MDRYLNRKSFVTTLGAAGLGLTMTVASLGAAPQALAQDDDSRPSAEEMRERFNPEEMQAEFYAAFTAALADELGVSDADEIDAGIRAALATVVDGLEADGLTTPGQATAVKALLESLEVPVSPRPAFGHGPAMFMRGGPGGAGFPGAAIAAREGEEPTEGPRAIMERFYPDFTAALADELGVGSADEVDGAIRLAMMAVIDGIDTDELPLPVSADALKDRLKARVAMAKSPLGPGLQLGPPPGMKFRALGHGGGGHGFPGRGEKDGGFADVIERGRAGDGDERGSRGDEDAKDDAGSDENEEDEENGS